MNEAYKKFLNDGRLAAPTSQEHEHLFMAGYNHALEELAAANAEIARFNASPTVECCRQMIENQAVKENQELFNQLAAANLVIEQMRELLPHELPGSFIAFGKNYAEASAKFAPQSDPMSKFKIRWFNDCVRAATLQPSTDALKARDRKRDASLLRNMVDNHLDCDLEKQAMLRESGEWDPNI